MTQRRAVRLTEAGRRALEFLAKLDLGASLHSMETTAGVFMPTLDALKKRGLIELGSTASISLAATVRQFQDAQKFDLFAQITPAGRAAIQASASREG